MSSELAIESCIREFVFDFLFVSHIVERKLYNGLSLIIPSHLPLLV